MAHLESGRMSAATGPISASVLLKQATLSAGVRTGPADTFGTGAAAGRGITAPVATSPKPKGGGVVSAGPGAAMLAARKRSEEAARIKLAAVAADGRTLVATGPQCAACAQPIVGRITNAMGKQLHPECFKCKGCGADFAAGGHIEHEGEAYCDECYWSQFAPKCARCALPIKTRTVVCSGKSYHAEHFACCGCGAALAGKPFKEYEGDAFCGNCFGERVRVIAPPAHPCGKCKKPIFGEYITINGQRMHAEHYKCEACGCDFTNGDCHEFDDKLYCAEDFRKLIKSICFGCRKPIAGRSLTAMGRVWHPEHFVCAHCHSPFPSSNFFENDGKPYCDLHYAQLFAQECAKCERPIIGTALYALDKYWHAEHYMCHQCDRLLSGNDTTVMEWEGRALCRACHHRLPADVRRAIERQKAASRQAAERRVAEERREKKRHDLEEREAMQEAASSK